VDQGNLIQRRPAETTSPVAMAIAMLIAWALDAGTEVIVPIAIIVAFVPAAVTWIVDMRRKPKT
jgi:hypothetical protein